MTTCALYYTMQTNGSFCTFGPTANSPCHNPSALSSSVFALPALPHLPNSPTSPRFRFVWTDCGESTSSLPVQAASCNRATNFVPLFKEAISYYFSSSWSLDIFSQLTCYGFHLHSLFSHALQDVLKLHFPTTNLNKPWQGLDLNTKLEELKNLQLCYNIRCILKHTLNIVEGWPKSAIAPCLIQIDTFEWIHPNPPLNFLITYVLKFMLNLT